MDEKQDRALRRLLKRLNAVRQTLRSDERGLLDGMVQESYPEAEGHEFKPAARRAIKSDMEENMYKKVEKPANSPEVQGHKVLPKAAPEVQGHKVLPKAAPKAAPEVQGHKVLPKAAPKAAPEVQGHKVLPKAAPKAAPEVEGHLMKEARKPAAKA